MAAAPDLIGVKDSTSMAQPASPQASSPIMYGQPALPGELLPWAWAEERLRAARNYWIATTRPDGRPHTRPVWGLWTPEGFLFSTGSLARTNLQANPAITVHLEGGDEAIIVEGVADRLTDPAALQKMCDDYTRKYDYPVQPTSDGVADSAGNSGPVFRVAPRVVFGWAAGMASPTRWRFT
jgi:Pyridoxamine 5'-phosphate oxidase